MNKDVIYIEPEDDITDIITKIENSKEKIVALVPPKKAGVFRSVVNIKLISKVGLTSEKTVVLVTTDPSIVKLAAATKIPITKDLKTPPAVPTADLEVEETSEEEVIEAPEEDESSEEPNEDATKESEPEDEKEEKPKKKEKKAKKASEKTGNPVIEWIKSHKKLTIVIGIVVFILIIFLIWAFAIAPAASITVGIQTDSKGFAENVTFTTSATDENIKDGKIYLQEKKVESVQEIKFDATGKKNTGEKASGDVIVYVFFKQKGTVVINDGATFTNNGLSFVASEGASLSWNGENFDECDNSNNASQLLQSGCQISGRIPVIATDSGTKYNIAATQAGWSTAANVSGAYSDKAMSGGTDNFVTVVEQSDIEKAKDQIKASKEEELKQKLYSSISDDMMIIESSFKQETANAEAKPAAGEEVKDGDTPILKATTTAKVFVVEKSKLEEFITEKAKLNDDQKIYEIKDPFIENFAESNDSYIGRLKTNYSVGPKVTDSEIVEMVKGRGIGDAQHDLKNINGIVEVRIDPSYPWVSVIPGDTNKITVSIEIKEKNSDSK